MGVLAGLFRALVGEKELNAVRVGMFAGQCYELFREYKRVGRLPDGVQMAIDPDSMLMMIESRVKLDPTQREALLEVARRFNEEINRKAATHGSKKATPRNPA